MTQVNILSKYVFRGLKTGSRIRGLCTHYNDKELIRTVGPTTTQDILFNNLKVATSTRNVLDMVSQHHSVMNNKHIMQALRSLFMLQKQGRSDISTQEIIKHKDFEKLCRNLKTKAGLIDIHETIEALKVVTYVGVPSNSTITQVLLQLIRQNINQLSLYNIMFLEFLLNQYDRSPLVDALKIALPIVFEISLPIKMERGSITHLTDYLYYASRNNLSDKTIENILYEMSNFTDNTNVKIAKSIVWSLADMDPKESFRTLLKKNLDVLSLGLNEMSYSDIETTLGKLISRYSKRFPFYYNRSFCDAVANYVIDHNIDYKHSIYILKRLRRVQHTNKYLLDYIVNKIEEDPSLLFGGNDLDVFHLVISLSLTDYRPASWDTVKKLVEDHDFVKTHNKDLIGLKLAAALCTLGIFREDVLRNCLRDELPNTLSKTKFFTDFQKYLLIYYSIKLLKPELSCLIPDGFKSEIVKNYPMAIEYPLERAIRMAFGGEKYIQSGLFSKHGHQIDHAVVFRKGGYPVSFTSSIRSQFIEDLDVGDNQLVLIMCLQEYHYRMNEKKMKTVTSLSLQFLEERGYTVVPVCLETWEALPDFERIPYLVQAVNNKVHISSLIENVL